MTGIYLSYEVISPHNTCSKVMLSAVKTILSFFWKQWKRSRVPPDSNWRIDVSSIDDDQPFIADELIDLQNSSTKKAVFMDMQADKFWCSNRNQFPNLSKKAFQILVPFVTTYSCEHAFSVMVLLKNKQRNRLDAMFPDSMRLALSKTKPRIKELAAKKQTQVSH